MSAVNGAISQPITNAKLLLQHGMKFNRKMNATEAKREKVNPDLEQIDPLIMQAKKHGGIPLEPVVQFGFRRATGNSVDLVQAIAVKKTEDCMASLMQGTDQVTSIAASTINDQRIMFRQWIRWLKSLDFPKKLVN
jgi:glutaredoxin 2